ncbi:Chemotaxis protein CheY [bacterium HR40]|nr:Chemotaxis protein CheY [bacterium HR40]
MPATQVLVVDDVRSERLLLRHALVDVEPAVEIVEADGHEGALAAYRRRPADVVFLDVVLRAATGLRTLEELLAFDPRAFVVMVSHHSTREHVLQALRLGARDFVVKPFSLQKLADILARAAHERRALTPLSP